MYNLQRGFVKFQKTRCFDQWLWPKYVQIHYKYRQFVGTQSSIHVFIKKSGATFIIFTLLWNSQVMSTTHYKSTKSRLCCAILICIKRCSTDCCRGVKKLKQEKSPMGHFSHLAFGQVKILKPLANSISNTDHYTIVNFFHEDLNSVSLKFEAIKSWRYPCFIQIYPCLDFFFPEYWDHHLE